MRERPILFSAPMVRAILEGRKSRTRRIVKPQPHHDTNAVEWNSAESAFVPWRLGTYTENSGHRTGKPFGCPYGVPGDRLWVRETHAIDGQLVAYDADGWAGAVCGDGGGGLLHIPHGFVSTDGAGETRRGTADKIGARFGLARYGGRWRPSIHMPRWASRITLEVAGVRVERLHAITEEDARAEGVWYPNGEGHCWPDGTARRAFTDLWRTINGAESWDANPWVWVVEFRRIDAAERAA